jgi:hypothetical protein
MTGLTQLDCKTVLAVWNEYQSTKEFGMAIEICDGCAYLDDDILHRCWANPDSCKDGKDCPDYIGEGNCGCFVCNE